MRRRFRFVGFFPDAPPMDGLLERWLEENEEPLWVAALVDGVNLELSEQLGRHLQLGPSFFMTSGLGPERMAKIWRHSVEPFIEDQFFGDESRIATFSWSAVWDRHGPQSAPGASTTTTEAT